MLQVQEYLRDTRFADNFAALEVLEAELGIKARIYEDDNLVLLDYNQIESPKTHPIVIECRSLILALDTFEVVSQKFRRFFNLGEAPDLVAGMDYSKSVVLEKADGSLSGVYRNPHTKQWEISTRGMAKAEGEHIMGGTFRERMRSAFGFADEAEFQKYFNTAPAINQRATYIFEFTSPENRIVTKYEKPEMVLIGATLDGREFSLEGLTILAQLMIQDGLTVRMPQVFPATDAKALVEMVNAFENLAEGVVVWEESTGRRVKIKSQTYLAAHKLRGNDAVPTRKNMMAVVLEGEIDELLAVFPEFRQYAEPVLADVAEVERQITEVWAATKDIAEQKAFALAVVPHGRISKVLFEARKLGAEPLKTFHAMPLNTKMGIVGL